MMESKASSEALYSLLPGQHFSERKGKAIATYAKE